VQHDDVKPESFLTSKQERSDDRSLKPLFLPANSPNELYVSDACRDIVHCFSFTVGIRNISPH